ncbi:hypothetical protein ACWEOO_21035 [Kribbella sp. NPDC004138]
MATNAGGARRGPRKRKCSSYIVFEKNLNRSRAFVRVFGEEDRKAGAPSNDERELLRGAVVFAIGALDNFIHELILELVPEFGGSKDAMRAPLVAIAKADSGLALRVALATTPAEAQEEFRNALDVWLETQTFHGVTRILNGTSYVGITLDESKLPADWRKMLDVYTALRHKIVHRGDTSVIKRDGANACLDLVEKIAGTINGEAVKYYH